MINRLKNLILYCLFLTLLLSCNGSESYLFTYQSSLRIIERQDHQKCVSQGLDYGEWDEIVTEMYWRCRYNLVQARKINDATTAEAIKNNAVIKKISEEILKNLSRAKYSALAKIEDDIELSDHNKCLAMGNRLGIGESSENYYRCRQDLILARIPPAPKVTNVFETAVLPADRADEYLKIAQASRSSNQEAVIVAEMMQKYPNCVGLNIDSDDFKRCSSATNQAMQCLTTIHSLQVKKELQDKIYCQQQAFVQFPDNYALAKDRSMNEIEKLKSDVKKDQGLEVNQENNATLLYLEGNRNLTENIGRNVESNDDNEKKSKEKLYSRVELLKLRERFIYQCNKKMEEKLPDFAQKTSNDCMNIAKNWANKDF